MELNPGAGHECGRVTGAQSFNGVSDFDLVIILLFTGISIKHVLECRQPMCFCRADGLFQSLL